MALLGSSQQRKVLLLSGDPGSSREAFLCSMAARNTAAGQPTQLRTLSLDGFEPLSTGLTGFVEYLCAFEPALSDAMQTALRAALARVIAVPENASSGAWACLFALVCVGVAPDAAFWSQFDAASEPPDLDRALASWLAARRGEGALIIHIPRTTVLSDPACVWLIERCGADPLLLLAFSCARCIVSDAIVGVGRGVCQPLRVEFAPLIRETAEAQLRAAAPSISTEAIDALWLASRADLVELNEAFDLWREQQVDAVSSLAPMTRARALRDQYETWLAALADDAPRMRRFIELAALSGPIVPALPLMAALGLNQAEAERFIDHLDEGACNPPGAGCAIFEDLAYRHPGFPGLSVYRLREPALSGVLLGPAPQEAARELWTFLSTRLALATRGVAQLYHNLAERLGPEQLSAPRQRLRLWVGAAELAFLRALLSDDVQQGRLPAQALFGTAQRDPSLPVSQRLALLEAAAPQLEAAGPEPRFALHVLRSELLYSSGAWDEALPSVERTLALLNEQASDPPGVRGLLSFLRATCLRQRGELALALTAFQEAAAAAAQPKPDGSVDHHNIGVCLAEAGHCHAERAEWQQASALLEAAIAELRHGDGSGRVHTEQLAQLEKNLALCTQNAAANSAP
jgi:hypothetical protein